MTPVGVTQHEEHVLLRLVVDVVVDDMEPTLGISAQ